MTSYIWKDDRYVFFVSACKIYVHEKNGNTIYNRKYYEFMIEHDWSKTYIMNKKSGKTVDVFQMI